MKKKNYPTITEEDYNHLLSRKAKGEYGNVIKDLPCKVGGTKKFVIGGTEKLIELKCTSIGCAFSANYVYELKA
jgi:hypothetical protein